MLLFRASRFLTWAWGGDRRACWYIQLLLLHGLSKNLFFLWFALLVSCYDDLHDSVNFGWFRKTLSSMMGAHSLLQLVAWQQRLERLTAQEIRESNLQEIISFGTRNNDICSREHVHLYLAKWTQFCVSKVRTRTVKMQSWLIQQQIVQNTARKVSSSLQDFPIAVFDLFLCYWGFHSCPNWSIFAVFH